MGLKHLQSSIFDWKNADLKRKYENFSSAYFFNIEQFVSQAIRIDEVPCLPFVRNGVIDFHFSNMACTYFHQVSSFVDTVKTLSPLYEYSEHLKVFVSSCQQIGLLNEGVDLNWGNICAGNSHLTQLNGKTTIAADIFNKLVYEMRMQAKSQQVLARIYTREKEADERYAEYCKYVDALFRCCDRLVVLRVDLFYQQEFSAKKTAQDAIRDLNHLVANRRCNFIFQFMLGYIVKLEYGVEKGIHFRAIFFFDGTERINATPVQFAQDIGEYWTHQITQGQGEYWNGHAKTNTVEKLNPLRVGGVNYYNANTQESLKRRELPYLCKISQYIRPKFAPNIRLLRRGSFPKMHSKKLKKHQQERLAQTCCPELVQKPL